jgi:hypothetical protein
VAPPQTTLRLGGCTVTLVGTIAGFAPDAARVEAAIAQAKPTLVALGVPAEDLPALAALAAQPRPEAAIGKAETPHKTRPRDAAGGQPTGASPTHPTPPAPLADDGDDAPFAGLDAVSAHLLHALRRFGPASAVPADLLAAQRAAKAAGVPLEAIDLDDAAHTELVTRSVGVLGLVGRSRAARHVLGLAFADAPDAYALAAAFDAERNGTRGLRKVEAAREAQMADRLRELAGRHAALVAVVPAARFAGVLALLAPEP